MRQGGFRFWTWLIGTYLVLMSPIAIVVFVGLRTRQPEIELAESLSWSLKVLVWPAIVVVIGTLIWRSLPFVVWLYWQICLLTDRLGAFKIGARISTRLAGDHFLQRSQLGSSSQWLYQQDLAHESKKARVGDGQHPDA